MFGKKNETPYSGYLKSIEKEIKKSGWKTEMDNSRPDSLHIIADSCEGYVDVMQGDKAPYLSLFVIAREPRYNKIALVWDRLRMNEYDMYCEFLFLTTHHPIFKNGDIFFTSKFAMDDGQCPKEARVAEVVDELIDSCQFYIRWVKKKMGER